MTKSKIITTIGYLIAFLLGALVASYSPLPGIYTYESQECSVGFATLEDMKFLVKELKDCKDEEQYESW